MLHDTAKYPQRCHGTSPKMSKVEVHFWSRCKFKLRMHICDQKFAMWWLCVCAVVLRTHHVQNSSGSVTHPIKLKLNGPSRFGVVRWYGWWVVQAPLPHAPPPVWPPKWNIVRVYLLPATHAPNFSPKATLGKKLIFDRLIVSTLTELLRTHDFTLPLPIKQ